jgi:hypothetical protein
MSPRRIIRSLLIAMVAPPGLIGWAILLLRPILHLIDRFSEMDFVATYWPVVRTFLDTGHGMLVSIAIGASIIGYSIVHAIHTAPASRYGDAASDKADSTQPAQKATTNTRPTLSITEIIFDPNGPTEMYADFVITNQGPRTIVRNWSLSVLNPYAKEHYNLLPRWVDLDKITSDQWGNPRRTNITQTPIETGESWPGRAGFTIMGEFPKERFGKAGIVFELSGEDIGANRVLSAPYRLPKDAL